MAGRLPWHVLAGLQVNVAEFEPKRLFMLSVYLLVMGLLLGYLAEQQKHLRAEKAVVTRLLSKVRVDAGLTGTLQQISREIVSMYGADRLLVASQEIHSHRTFLGELHNGDETSDFVWLDSSPRESKIYLEDFPGEAFYATSEGDRWVVVALDREGNQLPSPSTDAIVRLRQRQSFSSAVAVSFVFGGEWRGRVLVFDPSWHGDTQEQLRFLLDLFRQVGPAVYNVYLLHRLRRRASAAERARFARELHDGAVQSLIAVEMQVDVLRRQAGTTPAVVAGELGRIQGLLREEVLKLRELMQQMKSIDVDARRFLHLVTDTVERFERETGISARFVTDAGKLEMPRQSLQGTPADCAGGAGERAQAQSGAPCAGAAGFECQPVEPDAGRRRQGVPVLRPPHAGRIGSNGQGAHDHQRTCTFNWGRTHDRINPRSRNTPGNQSSERWRSLR